MHINPFRCSHLAQQVLHTAIFRADHSLFEDIPSIANAGQSIFQCQRFRFFKVLIRCAQRRVLLVQIIPVIQSFAIVADDLIISFLACKKNRMVIMCQMIFAHPAQKTIGIIRRFRDPVLCQQAIPAKEHVFLHLFRVDCIQWNVVGHATHSSKAVNHIFQQVCSLIAGIVHSTGVQYIVIPAGDVNILYHFTETGLILLQCQKLVFQVATVGRTGQHRSLSSFVIEIRLCFKRLRQLYFAPASQFSAKAFHCFRCAQCKPCTEERFPATIFVQDCLQVLSAGPIRVGLFRGENRVIGQFQPPFPNVLNAVPVCKMGKQPIQIDVHLLWNRQLPELHIQPDHQSLIHQLIQMLLFLIKRVFFACCKVPAIRTDADKSEPDFMLENT